MGNFRVGIGAPRDSQGAQTVAAPEQSVTNHESRRSILDVREFVFQTNVTRGEYPGVRSLQEIVDSNPTNIVVLNAGRLQIDPLHVRGALNTNQDLIDDDSALVVVAD